jgi:hypothetical protein
LVQSLYFYGDERLAGAQPFVGCPKLLIQCICSCDLNVEAILSNRRERAFHAVVTDPLNPLLHVSSPFPATIEIISASIKYFVVKALCYKPEGRGFETP